MSEAEEPKLKPGQTFTLVRTCDPYRPVYYAAASGDFNPIHIDPKVGEAAGLGGVILQGLCTMAWAAEACVQHLGDPTRLKRLKVRFSRPVRPGDTITVEGKVTAVEGQKVTVELLARNQDGQDVLKGGRAEGRVG